LTLFLAVKQLKDKTDKIVEKENTNLSQFIGKNSSNLQMELGKPDEDFKNDKGNLELIYNSKNMEYFAREDLKWILILW